MKRTNQNFNLNKRNRYQEEDQFDDEVVEETTEDEIETDEDNKEVTSANEKDDTFAKCYVALNTDGEYSCNKLTELVTKANKLGFQGVKLGKLTIKIDE